MQRNKEKKRIKDKALEEAIAAIPEGFQVLNEDEIIKPSDRVWRVFLKEFEIAGNDFAGCRAGDFYCVIRSVNRS